jgi:hypothetical protein
MKKKPANLFRFAGLICAAGYIIYICFVKYLQVDFSGD